ncbi:D-alanine--D-alanine ligase, partial [bacterium]
MRIAVLMGGTSSEVEISRKTGKAVASGLSSKGHKVEVFDWEEERIITDVEILRDFDVVFIAYHGGAGEDGRVQAALDVAGLKYTGSNYIASGIGMNKVLTKIIFENAGIPTPQWIKLDSRADVKNVLLEMLKSGFGLPAVVKPASEGSTIGITIAISEDELKEGVDTAFEYGDSILIEKYIPGREVTVSILGGLPLPVIEVIPKDGFYDYEHKYTKGASDYICPAKIPKKISESLQKVAAEAYNALGCRHYARVDFRLGDDGKIYCLEVNTLPGM